MACFKTDFLTLELGRGAGDDTRVPWGQCQKCKESSNPAHDTRGAIDDLCGTMERVCAVVKHITVCYVPHFPS